ncbi:MAG: hypothetical protein AB1454_05730 [Candidatus Auribacterota bacterium]
MSRWKSSVELDNEIKTIDQQDRLSFLYALSVFCCKAFLTSDFQVDARWKKVIVLTEHANHYVASMQKAGIDLNDNHQYLIFFQLFFHYEFFIDHHSTDPEAILHIMSEMHSSRKMLWPYVFGKKLYQKFNDVSHKARTQDLDAEQVAELLEGTPQGIFQIGNVLSGPFGFIRGYESRIFLPTLKILLWHCSDLGCQAEHLVTLSQFNSPFQRDFKVAMRYILDNFSTPSEWDKPLFDICRKVKWPNGRPFADIPAIIGDCIIGAERTALLSLAFQSEHNNRLISIIKNTGKPVLPPEDMAKSLSPEEQHQLLLVLPDKDIVKFLDELIARQDIKIPASESRVKKTKKPGLKSDHNSKLSNLGIRSCAHPPVIELAALIWSSYNELKFEEDLRWRLRTYETPTIQHSVIEYIRNQGPRSAVKNLILSSHTVTQKVCDRSWTNLIPGENEERLIDRLLWKLGFNSARYEETHQLLLNRIDDFKSHILQLGAKLSEKEKADVRSIGVNLFVSVEVFLEELVTYNVWLLSSDHFTVTDFRFTAEDASERVLKTLGSTVKSGHENFRWSVKGDNTIGTLLVYFQAFRKWLQEKLKENPIPIERPKEDYPHYAKDTVWVFPYKHTQLWADIPSKILSDYSNNIDKLYIQLSHADLVSIRNSLDHKRPSDSFPSTDRMLACVSRLYEIVELADRWRLVPKLYWMIKVDADYHGNICMKFEDYRGKLFTLWAPPLVMAGLRSRFGVPYLIAPFDLLNLPNTMLMFTIKSKSPYSEYWNDYPIRRFIPPKGNVSKEDIPKCDAFEAITSSED